MLELLLAGCSSVVLLLHGASLFLRALFAPRHAVARPIRCVPSRVLPRTAARGPFSLFLFARSLRL